MVAIGGGNNVKLDIRIVGVVADSKRRSVRDGVDTTLYTAFAQNPKGYFLDYYVRTAQTPESTENSIRAALHAIDAKLVPAGIKTMDDQISDNLSIDPTTALRTD